MMADVDGVGGGGPRQMRQRWIRIDCNVDGNGGRNDDGGSVRQ